VYKTKPRNLENLRHRILEKSALIESDFIKNDVTNFYDRIAQCQTVNDRAFQTITMINQHLQNVFTITFPVLQTPDLDLVGSLLLLAGFTTDLILVGYDRSCLSWLVTHTRDVNPIG